MRATPTAAIPTHVNYAAGSVNVVPRLTTVEVQGSHADPSNTTYSSGFLVDAEL